MAKRKSHTAIQAPTPAPIVAPVAPSRVQQTSTPKSQALPPFLILSSYISTTALSSLGLLFVLSQSHSHSPRSSPAAFLEALIENPNSVLINACIGLVIVQFYVGNWARRSRRNALGLNVKAGGVGREKRGFKGAMEDMRNNLLTLKLSNEVLAEEVNKVDMTHLPAAGGITLAGAVIFNVFAVLLGAPIFSKFISTFLLSLLTSLLAVAPLAIMLPPAEKNTWLRLFTALSPANDLERALLIPGLAAILGGWMGALPIPLDWNESWQSWPTTSVVGALGGYGIGTIIAVVVSILT